MCRSRRELSNEYLLEKIGFDSAENEPDLILLIFLPSRDLIFPYASHPEVNPEVRLPFEEVQVDRLPSGPPLAAEASSGHTVSRTSGRLAWANWSSVG